MAQFLDDLMQQLFGGAQVPVPDATMKTLVRPQSEMRSYSPTFSERTGNFIQDLLMAGGASPYPAGRVAHGVRDLLGFTPAGVPMALGDMAHAKAQNDPLGVAAAAMGIIPGVKPELAAVKQGIRSASYDASRPYKNVPDTLMGFNKQGTGKAFEEQAYPHSLDLKVTFPDSGDTFIDGIKGMNKEHALERARRNWPGAEFEIIPSAIALPAGAIAFTAGEMWSPSETQAAPAQKPQMVQPTPLNKTIDDIMSAFEFQDPYMQRMKLPLQKAAERISSYGR